MAKTKENKPIIDEVKPTEKVGVTVVIGTGVGGLMKGVKYGFHSETAANHLIKIGHATKSE